MAKDFNGVCRECVDAGWSEKEADFDLIFPTLNPKLSHTSSALLSQHVSTSPLPLMNNMQVVNDAACLITGPLPAYLRPQLLNLSLFSLMLGISVPQFLNSLVPWSINSLIP